MNLSRVLIKAYRLELTEIDIRNMLYGLECAIEQGKKDDIILQHVSDMRNYLYDTWLKLDREL